MRRLLLFAFVVSGCATTRYEAPVPGALQLGRFRVKYKDYSRADLCHLPAQALADELDQVNVVLAEFLQATSAGTRGVWAKEHMNLLKEANGRLQPTLEIHERNMHALARCEDPQDVGFRDVVRKGREMLRQSRNRLAETARLLAYGEARAELDKWKNQQGRAQANARQLACRQKSEASPVVFYVARDEQGLTEWHFCDGSKVVLAPQSAMQYLPKRGLKTPSDVQPYLHAAERYPQAQVQMAPRLPSQEKKREEPTDEHWLDEDRSS